MVVSSEASVQVMYKVKSCSAQGRTVYVDFNNETAQIQVAELSFQENG
jgi:hypothetical protein